jgi:hypothetical protein
MARDVLLGESGELFGSTGGFMRNLAVLTVFLMVFSGVALADVEFNFTYSDSNYSLQGILTASPDGGGVFTATSVVGTVAWLTGPDSTKTYPLLLVPSGVVPENANGDNIYGQDDLLYPNNPLQLLTIDPSFYGIGGLEFTVPAPPPLSSYNGGSNVVLYANGNGDYGSLESANLGGYDKITPTGGVFTLTAVPEPGVVILLVTMLAGLGGLAGVLKRKLR